MKRLREPCLIRIRDVIVPGNHGFGTEGALGTRDSAARAPAELVFSENLAADPEEPHTALSFLAVPLRLPLDCSVSFENEEPGVSRAMLADHHAAATMRHTSSPHALRHEFSRNNYNTRTAPAPICVVVLQS